VTAREYVGRHRREVERAYDLIQWLGETNRGKHRREVTS